MEKFKEIKKEIDYAFYNGEREKEFYKSLIGGKLQPSEIELFVAWIDTELQNDPAWLMKSGRERFEIDKNNASHWEFIADRIRQGFKVDFVEVCTDNRRSDLNLSIVRV
jgi:hypothetical protein